jgi:hypothetical protein
MLSKLPFPFIYLSRHHFIFLVEKRPAADVTGAPQPEGLLCNPMMKMMIIIISCPFPSNGALVE